VRIEPFGVEIWMNAHENHCAYNLAETCVESLTVEELLELSGAGDHLIEQMRLLKLTYGAIEGSDRLRSNIAGLYERQSSENVVVTHGAIGANVLVHQALVARGDRVVSVVPTYQQHYSIPESLGADVRILRLRAELGFLPDLDELRELAGDRARLIAITNPNNPTGALMDRPMLEAIARVADRCGAYVLCDEVYRGLDQEGCGTTASMADLYERGISTGSMSKAFSLAGLRLGWITAPRDVLAAVSTHRDYHTISVGMIDDLLASAALDAKEQILGRSRRITRQNLATLDGWVAQQAGISYVKPRSGTTALLRYAGDMTSNEFCLRLLERTGVLLTPGSAMNIEGHLRIGYANSHDVLVAGLNRMAGFLA
jgi:aspartate/methionine/tyrosine aminotransferase